MTVLGSDGSARTRPDRLVTEEPLEIRVGAAGQEPVPVTVTMRTPGHDFELAVGFLHTEGIVHGTDDVRAVRYCDLPDDAEQAYNIVTVRTAGPIGPDVARRSTVATASCGICGTDSIDRLATDTSPLPVDDGFTISSTVLLGLPDALRAGQKVFDRTGALHAAGLFDTDGTVLLVREDVGRHNAVDKVIGRSLLDGRTPLHRRVLVLSGRISFELVQKAVMARIPVLAAVGAPTNLAVATAERLGVTLVGFVRNGTANVYTHPSRITGAV